MQNEPCSILIVDDHFISATGAAALISSVLPDCRCQTFGSLCELWHEDHTLLKQGTVVISDFWMPDGTALDLIEQLRARGSPATVIVMSGDNNPELIRKVHAAGAWAFISKSASTHELTDLLQQMLAGAAAPRTASEAMAIEQTAYTRTQGTLLIPMRPMELGLTTRQAEILQQVLQGHANKVIARTLGIAEQTVKEHVSTLLGIFAAENRIDLVRQFAERRIRVVLE